MCNCEHATTVISRIFFCNKYKLFGTERLSACILAQVEAEWRARLSRVPPSIKARMRMIYTDIG